MNGIHRINSKKNRHGFFHTDIFCFQIAMKKSQVICLLGRLFERGDRNKGSFLFAFLEFDNAVNQSIEGVVFSHSHVQPGIMNRAPLPDDDTA